jgi:hypothetical protein
MLLVVIRSRKLLVCINQRIIQKVTLCCDVRCIIIKFNILMIYYFRFNYLVRFACIKSIIAEYVCGRSLKFLWLLTFIKKIIKLFFLSLKIIIAFIYLQLLFSRFHCLISLVSERNSPTSLNPGAVVSFNGHRMRLSHLFISKLFIFICYLFYCASQVIFWLRITWCFFIMNRSVHLLMLLIIVYSLLSHWKVIIVMLLLLFLYHLSRLNISGDFLLAWNCFGNRIVGRFN